MKKILIPCALVTILGTTSLAWAGDTGAFAASPANVTLLPGWRMENGNHMAALHVVLAEGWKTYWRAPGDGGIPPDFDWSTSGNMGSVVFHWPVPEVILQGDMETVGYRQELILPMEITPNRLGDDITLSAELLIGICETICVPVESALFATLAASATTPDAAIQRAIANRPDTRDEAGVTDITCVRQELSDGVRVTAHLSLPAMSTHETVVFEVADPTIWVSEATERRSGDMLTAHADLVAPSGQPFALAGDELRVTVLGAGRAVDINGCDRID